MPTFHCTLTAQHSRTTATAAQPGRAVAVPPRATLPYLHLRCSCCLEAPPLDLHFSHAATALASPGISSRHHNTTPPSLLHAASPPSNHRCPCTMPLYAASTSRCSHAAPPLQPPSATMPASHIPIRTATTTEPPAHGRITYRLCGTSHRSTASHTSSHAATTPLRAWPHHTVASPSVGCPRTTSTAVANSRSHYLSSLVATAATSPSQGYRRHRGSKMARSECGITRSVPPQHGSGPPHHSRDPATGASLGCVWLQGQSGMGRDGSNFAGVRLRSEGGWVMGPSHKRISTLDVGCPHLPKTSGRARPGSTLSFSISCASCVVFGHWSARELRCVQAIEQRGEK